MAAMDITERKRAEARVAFMAHHDALTALPNRLLLRAAHGGDAGPRRSAMAAAWRRSASTSTISSRSTTRSAIRSATCCCRRWRGACAACAREGDCVARLGGDEFAILQADVTQPEQVSAFAQRLLAVISEPYELDGHQVTDRRAASASRSRRATATMPTACSRTPTWRSIAPRPTAAARSASSSRRWMRACRRAAGWRSICARRLQSDGLELHYQPLVDLRIRRGHRLRGAGPLAASGARHDPAGRNSFRSPRRPA